MRIIGTICLLLIGLVILVMGGTRKKTPPILLALLMLAMAGCATNGVKQDDFPAGVPCVQAQKEAVAWYVSRYGTMPDVPPVKVIITDAPPLGYGGTTDGSGSGYIVRVWKDQNPFYGSLVHEMRHTLVLHNRGDHSEGAVQ